MFPTIALPLACPNIPRPPQSNNPPTEIDRYLALNFCYEVSRAHQGKQFPNTPGVTLDHLYSASSYANDVLNAIPGGKEGLPAGVPVWAIVLNVASVNANDALWSLVGIHARADPDLRAMMEAIPDDNAAFPYCQSTLRSLGLPGS
ncbi:hypothetical protein C8J56DRAFT_1050007 [Mycena floridula]|nr:hypothetical protein C8J56DRAFT_1050007 [Mycena floridula]